MSGTPVAEMYGFALDEATAASWRNAVSLASRGHLDQGIEALRGLLGRNPDFVPALVQIAHWCFAQDRYREARSLTLKAAAQPLGSCQLVLEVVRLLRRFEDAEAIERLVAATDWKQCDEPALLVSLAAELAPAGLLDRAQDALRQAGCAGYRSPEMARLQATLHVVHGRFDEARQLLTALAGARREDEPWARWMLSLQSGNGVDLEEDVHGARRCLAQAVPGTEAEALSAFALHNVLHTAGRYHEAWTALERGCRAKAHLLRYRHEQHLSVFDALLALPPPAGLEPVAHGEPTPILVVGMHRSGTTLLERILGGHPAVTDGGESYALSAALRYATDHYSPMVVDLPGIERARSMDLAEFRRQAMAYFRWKAKGRPFVTEKLPSNFLLLGFVLAALPQARVLHMRRDAMDTCFSNLRTYFSNAAPYSYDQRHLGQYFLRYRELMGHWHRLWPGRILDIEYDALISDPAREARRLAHFCGMSFDSRMLDFDGRAGTVATASAVTARSGIRRDRGGVWRRYEAYLEPLKRSLGVFERS